jgi:hypothetical protein
MSTILRRSFATTARRYRPSNGKPPPQERNELPHPPKDQEPTKPEPESSPNDSKKPKSEIQRFREDIFTRIIGSVQPRSEFFLFAFANPKLSYEKRKRAGLSLLAAVVMAMLLDPYMMRAMKQEKEEDAGERGHSNSPSKAIAGNSPDTIADKTPNTMAEAQAEGFVAMVCEVME